MRPAPSSPRRATASPVRVAVAPSPSRTASPGRRKPRRVRAPDPVSLARLASPKRTHNPPASRKGGSGGRRRGTLREGRPGPVRSGPPGTTKAHQSRILARVAAEEAAEREEQRKAKIAAQQRRKRSKLAQGGDNRRAGRIKALSVELAMEQEVVARAQQQVQERARRKAAATQRTQGTAALGRKDFAAAVSAFKAVSRSNPRFGLHS